ncbi:MAG TPA: SDR family oxidoreductase [Arthrobacter sp.]|nr:SDR family oxidoreductase [Arthrobacter sp.]
MDLRLAGRRALVTASSGGIGAAVARQLGREGCTVLVHGRDRTRADSVAGELQAMGAAAEVMLGDIANHDDAAALADHARAWGVEILVNNAGPFAEHDWNSADLQSWVDSFEGNVVTAVRMIRAVVPGMRTAGWGRIINIGSRAATTPLPNMVDYSAAKAAVLNLTASLAHSLANSGVTANIVSPGIIRTEGLERMFERRAADAGWNENQKEQAMAEYAPNPAGRLGTSGDIANAVAYLASPLAGYVNGTELRVDGGISPLA